MKTIYQNEKFSIETHHQIPNNDITQQNMDFWIKTEAKSYWGSAATIANIQYLMQRYSQTGENASGAFYWQTNTIIIYQFTVDSLVASVKSLIEDSRDNLSDIFYLII
ncbi:MULTISPECIES: hypothetical protein [unclassified Acinetobacter]|uniref:hypothetical protein n=1 Tax=unclassified Acinetobacter TaxID=196816 RepID=UPI0018AB710D|nr:MULTISPECIES: hypothetical protein [unclassified Acinetobacter]MBJ9952621.1 hypothetical protein [Acinetobacter baumannii]